VSMACRSIRRRCASGLAFTGGTSFSAVAE